MSSEILKRPLPYIALIIAHVIWGGNYVIAKITLQEFPPMTLGFMRFGLACLLIIPFLMAVDYKKKQVKLEHLPRFIAVGLLMASINITLFYLGLKRIPAIDASLLELSIPIISVIAGWMILKEKIYVVNLAGVLIALAGSITILGIPLLFLGNFAAENLFGHVLILGATISYVAGSMLSKKLLKTYPPLVITAFTFLIAAVVFFVPAMLEYISNPGWVNKVSILGIMGFFYIAIFGSICAYFLLLYALSKMEVSHANLFQYLEPAVAATLAVPLLGERISFSFIIATVLIILGVYWGTLGKQEHHHPHHKSHRI